VTWMCIGCMIVRIRFVPVFVWRKSPAPFVLMYVSSRGFFSTQWKTRVYFPKTFRRGSPVRCSSRYIPTHKIRRSFPVQAKSPPAPYPRPRSLRGHTLIDVMCTNLPRCPTLSLMPASGIVALSDASTRYVRVLVYLCVNFSLCARVNLTHFELGIVCACIVRTSTHQHTYVRTHAHVCVSLFLLLCVSVFLYMSVCVYVCMYVCLSVCTYVYVCIDAHICYKYIYIYL